MAQNQERAARIKQLKQEHPEIRWRMVAEYVGVTERAVADWASTGGIAYDNAEKLAEFFRSKGVDVSVDYIWHGEQQEVPDLMSRMARNSDRGDQLDRIEDGVYDNRSRLETVIATLRDEIAELTRQVAEIRELAIERVAGDVLDAGTTEEPHEDAEEDERTGRRR